MEQVSPFFAKKEGLTVSEKKTDELKEEQLEKVSGGGSTNFPCPKCGGPGYICNGHYWCDNYKTCGYHHAVAKTADGQSKY